MLFRSDVKKMSGDDKLNQAKSAGDGISKNDFESQMPKLFEALSKCWDWPMTKLLQKILYCQQECGDNFYGYWGYWILILVILGSVPILFVFVCVRVIWVGDKFLER